MPAAGATILRAASVQQVSYVAEPSAGSMTMPAAGATMVRAAGVQQVITTLAPKASSISVPAAGAMMVRATGVQQVASGAHFAGTMPATGMIRVAAAQQASMSAFDMLDRNHDGMISRAEVNQAQATSMMAPRAAAPPPAAPMASKAGGYQMIVPRGTVKAAIPKSVVAMRPPPTQTVMMAHGAVPAELVYSTASFR
mmetsp:Transcript_17701/g.62009  ORF Transcript_17701/g.62009 Transcript_17701/m.62009 type:complete len:197 (+) Transcript_17701:1-591(+)